MFPSAPHGVLSGLETYTFRPMADAAAATPATPAAAHHSAHHSAHDSADEELAEPTRNTMSEQVGEAISGASARKTRDPLVVRLDRDPHFGD
eukprot:1185557-Prorocentrum_minimum.AAC.2